MPYLNDKPQSLSFRTFWLKNKLNTTWVSSKKATEKHTCFETENKGFIQTLMTNYYRPGDSTIFCSSIA